VEVANTPDIVARASAELPPDAAEPEPAYRAALEWIWSFSARRRSEHEMAAQRARKLERMQTLLAALGDPQRAFPSLLVAGTKGKGSTVALAAECLRAAGHRTGRYTSPHLVNWRERTWVDGQPISVERVLELAPLVRRAAAQVPQEFGPLTTFEVGTALSFLHFAREAIEVGVIEVGVGGRYDATNLVEPLVSVIAPVSYDHTPTLGSTLSRIAWHKAGILRAERPGIVAPQSAEALTTIEAEAQRLGARLELVGRDWWWTAEGDARAPITVRSMSGAVYQGRVGLLGDHQRDNATAAVAALHALSQVRPDLYVSPPAVANGLEHVDWPGRLHVLAEQPWLVLDGAHNAASAQVLEQAVHSHFSFERLLLVLGLTEGKDAAGVLEALAPPAQRLFVTSARHERAAPPAELAQRARTLAPNLAVTVEPDLDRALGAALAEAGPSDLVLVTGSLFLVGEALMWWRKRLGSPENPAPWPQG
jgi:dihydrofolate synthase / folylpolyglutamate synthase